MLLVHSGVRSSDGVHKFCTHRELEKIMCKGMMVFRSADRMKEIIRKCVIESGADDNYSAIVCRGERGKLTDLKGEKDVGKSYGLPVSYKKEWDRADTGR